MSAILKLQDGIIILLTSIGKKPVRKLRIDFEKGVLNFESWKDTEVIVSTVPVKVILTKDKRGNSPFLLVNKFYPNELYIFRLKGLRKRGTK